jgi:hypothetical protein
MQLNNIGFQSNRELLSFLQWRLLLKTVGTIILKDSKVATFYTNDLATTPSQPILDATNKEAVVAVHGFGDIKRWTGTEVLNRTMLQVPAIICAYNHFMNSVDQMDQLRSTVPTRQREKRLSMTLFTLVLDMAINNAKSIKSK